MNKFARKFAIVAVLSLALICCVIAAKSPVVDVSASDEDPTPTYTVTIRYTGLDGQEIMPPETVLVPKGGMVFTHDEDRDEELCTLTIRHLDSDGREIEPAEIVSLPVGAAYAVGVTYSIGAPRPDPAPELPAPPAIPTSTPAN